MRRFDYQSRRRRFPDYMTFRQRNQSRGLICLIAECGVRNFFNTTNFPSQRLGQKNMDKNKTKKQKVKNVMKSTELSQIQ